MADYRHIGSSDHPKIQAARAEKKSIAEPRANIGSPASWAETPLKSNEGWRPSIPTPTDRLHIQLMPQPTQATPATLTAAT